MAKGDDIEDRAIAFAVRVIKIGLKELNETRIWLRIIVQSELLKENQLKDLLDECDQLCRIFSASITTSRGSSS